MAKEIKINIPLCHLAWFETSPDAGDPDCICSYCGFVIPEDEVPVRLFGKSDKLEIRLHSECIRLLTSPIPAVWPGRSRRLC